MRKHLSYKGIMQRNEQHLCRGSSSVSFCSSTLRNRWLLRLLALSPRRYVLSYMCSSCSQFFPQLIRDLGITNGNETQVGYYVGLMVCWAAKLSSVACSLTWNCSSNRCFSWLRHSQYYTGVGYLIALAESQSFWLASLGYHSQCIASASQGLFGVLFSGISRSFRHMGVVFIHPMQPKFDWRTEYVLFLSWSTSTDVHYHATDGNIGVIKRCHHRTEFIVPSLTQSHLFLACWLKSLMLRIDPKWVHRWHRWSTLWHL